MSKEEQLLYLFRKRGVSGAADECWPWHWRPDRAGYGTVCTSRTRNGKVTTLWAYAHRISYLAANGSLPPNMDVCHSCDNPACVNPAHLWLGSQLDNTRDAARKGRLHNSGKTHCKRGHPFDAENTGIDRRGDRFCITCAKIRGRQWYEKRRKLPADNDELEEAINAFAA